MTTYCLKLEDDCWYVGKTNDFPTRMKDHFRNKGARWTRLHKPIEIACIKEYDCELDMYNYAVKKYGKEYVRGAWNTKC